MGIIAEESIAFAMPGGEGAARKGTRPVDLDHLASQTFGDRTLEAEVLAMFCQQAQSVCDRLKQAEPAMRATLAHTLKGSSRGVGAFGLASLCEALENTPADTRLAAQIKAEVIRVCDFIAAITR